MLKLGATKLRWQCGDEILLHRGQKSSTVSKFAKNFLNNDSCYSFMQEIVVGQRGEGAKNERRNARKSERKCCKVINEPPCSLV